MFASALIGELGLRNKISMSMSERIITIKRREFETLAYD